MLDFVRHAQEHTPEPVKVYGAAVGALGVSYAGALDALRATLLILSITYTAIKIYKAIKGHKSDTDFIK